MNEEVSMKAIIGWVGVLVGSIGLGFVLYGQVASNIPAEAPLASSHVDDVREPRPTVYVTRTKRVVDPGAKIRVDVPVTVPAPSTSPPAPGPQPVAQAQKAPVAGVPTMSAPSYEREADVDERSESRDGDDREDDDEHDHGDSSHPEDHDD
jgi:hypothetical protein